MVFRVLGDGTGFIWVAVKEFKIDHRNKDLQEIVGLGFLVMLIEIEVLKSNPVMEVGEDLLHLALDFRKGA